MLHVAKRPLFLLAGASAGFMYLGDDGKALTIGAIYPTSPQVLPHSGRTMKRHSSRSRTLKATSRQELGLQQSLIRDVACWISSASVTSTRQAFTTPSVPFATVEEGREALEAAMKSSEMYQNLVGWLQQISPDKTGWDPDHVLGSSSFSILVNLLSDTENSFSLQEDLKKELYRAVGVLSTNEQCARAIAERATRYGKQALLNLAEAHGDDPRVGNALHQLASLDSSDCHFGPANLASLLSLAVADVPDQYLEFALWGLTKAATPEAVSRRYKLRKVLFGDDSTAKTRRKLINSDKLWDALGAVGQGRSELVQLQAARLINELSNDAAVAQSLRDHAKSAETLVQWLSSSREELACTAFEIVSKLAGVDHDLQHQLVDAGALDTLRARVLEDSNRRVTAKLLEAIRCLAVPTAEDAAFVLDRDALSFVSDSKDGEPLYDDDIENINIVLRHGYVDGWIELFTAFLKSSDEGIRDEAALCLEQIATHGAHKDQVVQEWLIAVLDSVLDKVPPEVAKGACSVREARSRTLPIQGHTTDTSQYEASHAKALRALAFVMERKECQEELIRRGGIPILKLLLQSENGVVQRETARVLANLFTCDDMAQALQDFATNDRQLEEALEKWTQSDDIRLETMAHRARSNRRYQNSLQRGANSNNEVKYLDGIHPLHLSGSTSAQQSNYDVDIVFVHGLLGCPFSTWTCGEEEDTVWAQQWLLDDMKQVGLNPRVLSVGYDSQLLASGSVWKPMCFEETGSEMLTQLNAARVGCGDRPVVFVTHSLGGVLLKQVLLASANSETEDNETTLIDNVNGVVFFGVPHHGSPVAQRIQTFKPRRITQHPVTEHLHGTPHLEMLNDWCSEVFEEKNIPSLSVGESLPCRLPVIGVEALVVPSASANPGFGEFVPVADATHVDVCKPASTEDLRYTLVRKFISKNATSIATQQSTAA
ncbi:Serine active site containing protein 1 [Phytophthora pseudosyringae]|uniref:Serine active site containing protein 1 n=1 Tax=Phytophthora pseudosyringae TaxID=221518 RepID=A0A8T1VFA9_9STRA|nr:Serine active site containing protein 1 [Phytophthora pseudosyringae]